MEWNVGYKENRGETNLSNLIEKNGDYDQPQINLYTLVSNSTDNNYYNKYNNKYNTYNP